MTHTSPNLLDLYRNFDSATKCITILIRINSYTKITEISSHCQPFPCHTNSVELSVDLWGKNMQLFYLCEDFVFVVIYSPLGARETTKIVIIWKKTLNCMKPFIPSLYISVQIWAYKINARTFNKTSLLIKKYFKFLSSLLYSMIWIFSTYTASNWSW